MTRTTTHVVLGMKTDGFEIKNRPITVRITKDVYGMTISLADESESADGENVMLAIPIEPIADRLKEILK